MDGDEGPQINPGWRRRMASEVSAGRPPSLQQGDGGVGLPRQWSSTWRPGHGGFGAQPLGFRGMNSAMLTAGRMSVLPFEVGVGRGRYLEQKSADAVTKHGSNTAPVTAEAANAPSTSAGDAPAAGQAQAAVASAEPAATSTLDDDRSTCCATCGSTVSKKEDTSVQRNRMLEAAARGEAIRVCKLLVIGNAKCGKTSLIRRFVHDNFDNAYRTTIGVDYVRKDVVLEDGRWVRLQLWDIAGQDRFAKLTRAYFARARGVLLVCDVTRETSFEALANWKREIDEWALTEGRDAGIPVVLIANKCDLLTDAASSFEAGARMVDVCHKHRFSSWYVASAKVGNQVNAAFMDLVHRSMEEHGDEHKVEGSMKQTVTAGFRLDDSTSSKPPSSSASVWTSC